MEEKEKTTTKDVPYIVFEGEVARLERILKKVILLLIATLLILFTSNMAWLYTWNQYDYSEEVQTIEADQDGKGVNIIGGQDVNYGAKGQNGNKKANSSKKKR